MLCKIEWMSFDDMNRMTDDSGLRPISLRLVCKHSSQFSSNESLSIFLAWHCDLWNYTYETI